MELQTRKSSKLYKRYRNYHLTNQYHFRSNLPQQWTYFYAKSVFFPVKPLYKQNTELCWFQVAMLSSETIIQVEASLLIWNMELHQSKDLATRNTVRKQSSNISQVLFKDQRDGTNTSQGLHGDTLHTVI